MLVTGNPYRHPAVLANMAATLDVISGGRLELGLGAGWNQEESDAYGIDLPPLKERFDRFDEALEVITSLLTNTVSTFEGQHYQLHDARCEPKPVQQPHPPICIGGSGPEPHAAGGGSVGPALEPPGRIAGAARGRRSTSSTSGAPRSDATRRRS